VLDKLNTAWASLPQYGQSTVWILVITVALIICVALLTLWERKVIGWMQLRRGPNRVRIFGLLPGVGQPFADVFKLLLKEVVIPAKANKALFWDGRVEIDADGHARQVPLPNPMKEERLHLALSDDGRHWKPLDGNKPVWDQWLRDPFLQRGPEMELSCLHQAHGRPLNKPGHRAFDVTRVRTHDQNVLQPFHARRIVYGGRQRMDRPLQNLRERVLMNGLLHIIEGAGPQPFHRRFGMAYIGEEDDRTGRASLANLLHQRDSFLFWEKEIHNHDIGLRHLEGR